MSARKNFSCPICGKRFRASNGIPDHARDVHGEHGVKARFHEPPRHEPSIADLVRQAEIDRNCGEPIDDWLADMLPD